MSFLTTCSDQLRKQISAVTKLSLRDVEKFHEQRSDLVVGLTQIADMLEGNFTVEEEKPAAKQVQKPQASLILSEKGNLVRVDFRKRKVLVSGSDNPPPKRRR